MTCSRALPSSRALLYSMLLEEEEEEEERARARKSGRGGLCLLANHETGEVLAK